VISVLHKSFNASLASFSFLASTVVKKPFVKGMPPAVSAELTNYCNLACPECTSGSGIMTRARGNMDPELFDRIINELGPSLLNMNLYFQGEPMLHPGFFRFLDRSKIIKTTVSTNGHFLSEENAEKIVKSGLNKLVISLDGPDQETYSTYRINGSLKKVLDGIGNISAAKKKYRSAINIVIQVLVNRLNESRINDIKKMVRDYDVKLNLKSMQIVNLDKMDAWLPVNTRYRRYDSSDGGYQVRSKLPNRCSRLWLNPVITWDGKVLPCCFDKNAEYIMGDLNQNSFREIWFSRKYKDFRRSVLSGRSSIEICRNCTSGLKGVRT
jgi:radical SAM protein with 4Fe4S-binding SPASM domain